MTDSRLSSLAMLSIENDCARSLDYDNVITAFANKKVRSRLFKWYCVFITFSCFSVSLLSFRSVCINVLLNSGIGAEFFMTCTFGIGMLYSDISLFTYVQIVVYFLNAAFQFYTSKVIWPVRRGSCAYFGGGPKLECYGTAYYNTLKNGTGIHSFLLGARHLKGGGGEQAGKFACCILGQDTSMGRHQVKDKWSSFPSEERFGGR